MNKVKPKLHSTKLEDICLRDFRLQTDSTEVFVCGAHNIEKLNLKNSLVVSLSNQSITELVPMKSIDNTFPNRMAAVIALWPLVQYSLSFSSGLVSTNSWGKYLLLLQLDAPLWSPASL